jgi:quercetin dioxygenase-like cupin family protein
MSNPFTLIDNIEALLAEIPDDSIVSRTVYSDDDIKVILFGFAPGQELSEHTAAKPALLHFLSGEADLTLGDVASSAGPGTFVRMEPHLPHSVVANTQVVMLLTLLSSAGS